MRSKGLRVLIAIAALLTGCDGCKKTVPGMPVVVAAAERAKLEADLLAEVGRNQQRSCKRAVLRGTPTTGRADEDLLAIIAPRPDQPLADCVKALEVHHESLSPDMGRVLTPDEIVDRCAALPDAIARAVQHEDACSPYLAGRRGVDNLIPLLGETEVVARIVARRIHRGEGAGAARLAFDFIRLLHDLRRGDGSPGGGGASLAVAMIDVICSRILFDHAEQPLIDDISISPAQREELAQELAILEATDPPFGEVVGERGRMLQMWVRSVKPKGWVPPGGPDWGSDGDPMPMVDGVDPIDVGYLGWISQAELGQRFVAACPPTANAVKCEREMARVTSELVNAGAAQSVERSDPLDVARTRKVFLDRISALIAPALLKEVGRFWMARWQLRALRLQTWILAHRDARGHCPSLATIASNAGAVRLDPANDRPIDVQLSADGSYRLRPARELEITEVLTGDVFKNYRQLSYSFACRR